jgi:hypothetical protein
MAGYSGTPLPKKLGIREGHRVLVRRGGGFALTGLPSGARLLTRRRAGARYDLILAFCRDRRALATLLPECLESLPPEGALWLCWPKKTSGVLTDVSESDVRAAGLAAGVVDVKICAVDEVWSGLKFVVRKVDRPTWPDPARDRGPGGSRRRGS